MIVVIITIIIAVSKAKLYEIIDIVLSIPAGATRIMMENQAHIRKTANNTNNISITCASMDSCIDNDNKI